MLRKHRNALLEMIRAANISPKNFNPKEEIIGKYNAFRLQVRDSRLYFLVRETMLSDGRGFDYKYSKYERAHPKPEFPEVSYPSSWYGFERVEQTFKQWLETSVQKYLADQAEEEEDQSLPDLWAELDLSSDTIGDVQDLQNNHFSIEEQTRIAEMLREFENEIKRRDILTTDQIKLLHEQVDYLIQSSARLGRKDWLNGAIGALLGYTLQAALTTDTATQIMRLGWEAIKWIAHNPPLLPGVVH